MRPVSVRILLAVLFPASVAVACGGSTAVTDVLGPDLPRCDAQVSAPSSPVPADGGTVNVSVVTSRDCGWTAAADVPWLRVTPTSGQGDGSVAVIADRNGATNTRSGGVTVGATRVVVVQAAAPPPPPPPPPAPNPAPAPPNPAPAPPAPAPVPNPPPAPPAPAPRPPAPVPNPVPNPAPVCTFRLSPDDRSFGVKGGHDHFDVKTSSGCSWTASTNVGWIQLSNSSGSGDGRVNYDVQPNPTKQDRFGIITVGGATHEVDQDGK